MYSVGTKLRHRRNLSVSAGVNVFGTSVIVPDVGLKLVITIVPQNAGVLSVVRIDGTTSRISKLFDGSALVVGENNTDELMAPKFYSFIPDEVAYNFRYSVLTVFDLITVYSEKEHAWALQLQ